MPTRRRWTHGPNRDHAAPGWCVADSRRPQPHLSHAHIRPIWAAWKAADSAAHHAHIGGLARSTMVRCGHGWRQRYRHASAAGAVWAGSRHRGAGVPASRWFCAGRSCGRGGWRWTRRGCPRCKRNRPSRISEFCGGAVVIATGTATPPRRPPRARSPPAQGRFLTITSVALTKNFRWLKEIW